MMYDPEQAAPSPATDGTAGTTAGHAPPDPGQPAPPMGAAAGPVTSPHLPVDQGLSGLGILMELGGSIFVIGWLLGAVVTGVAALAGTTPAALIAVFMVLGTIRSSRQARAGRAIVSGDSSGALVPLRRYVQLGLAHAASALLLAPSLGLGTALLVAGALAVWPTTMILLVLRTPIAQTAAARGVDEEQGDSPDLDSYDIGEQRYKLPLPADNGYESLAVLMFVLAAASAAFLLVVASIVVPQYLQSLSSTLLDGPGSRGAGTSTWIIVLLALLAVRSVVHLRAAVLGLRGATTTDFEIAATRYVNIGMSCAFLGAGCAALSIGLGSGGGGSLLLIAGAMFWVLHMWPRIVGRFVRERSLDELRGLGHASSYRAPDKGLTALGWLLLAYGLFEVVTPLFSLGVIDLVMSEVRAPELGGLSGTAMGMLVVLPLIAGAAKAVAGVALVRMTPRYLQAAWVFIVVGLVLAVVGNWHSLRMLGSLSLGHLSASTIQDLLMHVGGLTVAVLLPVTTLVLIRRADKLPGAQATFRR